LVHLCGNKRICDLSVKRSIHCLEWWAWS